jgi:alpha-tubulin suppressor-like RCC1 family protein
MMPTASTLIRRLAPLLAPAVLIAALGCHEDAESPTAPEAGAALDIIPAHALSFRQVSAGGTFTCGVTTANRAYCWGTGWLGNGQFSQSLRPVAVAGGLSFRQVSAGWGHNLRGDHRRQSLLLGTQRRRRARRRHGW